MWYMDASVCTKKSMQQFAQKCYLFFLLFSMGVFEYKLFSVFSIEVNIELKRSILKIWQFFVMKSKSVLLILLYVKKSMIMNT